VDAAPNAQAMICSLFERHHAAFHNGFNEAAVNAL
jgi:hypothetical protein